MAECQTECQTLAFILSMCVLLKDTAFKAVTLNCTFPVKMKLNSVQFQLTELKELSMKLTLTNSPLLFHTIFRY